MEYLIHKILVFVQSLGLTAKDYIMESTIITVAVSTETQLDISGEYYFFANAFTTSGTISGNVIGSDDAINLNPTSLLSKIANNKMFKDRLKLKNLSSTAIMHVEFIRIIPIKNKNQQNEHIKEVFEELHIVKQESQIQ